MESQYEKLGPDERREFRKGMVEVWKQATHEMTEMERVHGRDSQQFRNAESRRNRVRNAFVNMDSQEAINEGVVVNLNEAADRMKEGAHNDLRLDWLKANGQQILNLSGQNLRRLMISQNFDSTKKEVILDSIEAAAKDEKKRGLTKKDREAQGIRLKNAMRFGQEVMRDIWRDYARRKGIPDDDEDEDGDGGGGQPGGQPSGRGAQPAGGGEPGGQADAGTGGPAGGGAGIP